MTEDKELIKTYDICSNGAIKQITVHQINSFNVPAVDLSMENDPSKERDAVLLNPIKGLVLLSINSDISDAFKEMKMIDSNIYSISNLGIKEIGLGGHSVWIVFNEQLNKSLKRPYLNVGHIQQTVRVDDFLIENVVCQGSCMITKPEFRPFSPFEMDSVMNSIRFYKERNMNPTFCLDLHLLYDRMNNISGDDE